MLKNKKVYIIILNWNGWRDTIECMESVYQSSYPNYQVIVIDNGSTDGSEERILNHAKEKSIAFIRYNRETAEKGGLPGKEVALSHLSMIFIQTGNNLGYAGGNNVGLRYVLNRGDYEYIWLLNNDTVIDRDALTEMVKLAETDERIGMVGSKLLYYDRPNILQAAGGCRIVSWMGNASVIASNEEDSGKWDYPFEPDYINGASLLIKKGVTEAVGLMDEKYFLYWEDADWGIRARKKEYRLIYCPKSRVRHKEGGTSGGITRATDYYWVRNGLLFMKKFYPVLLPLIPFSYFIKYTIIRLIRRQPLNFISFIRGILDFFMMRWGNRNYF